LPKFLAKGEGFQARDDVMRIVHCGGVAVSEMLGEEEEEI